MFALSDLFADIPPVYIVDIGASLIDGPPAYQSLLNKAHLVGFEPNPAQFQRLQTIQTSHLTYLPYAIGDGQEATLNICAAPGMTSLLEPDMQVLAHFQGFEAWAKVVNRQRVTTKRLDDVEEIAAMDYLKIDVQGGEMMVLKGAVQRLKETLVVHTEVQFVPFYTDQPLFADIDQTLRQAGFYFHKFTSPLISRLFKPLEVPGDPYAGLSQVLWSDAVYFRKFTELGKLSPAQLLKIALIAHNVYESFDLASLALGYVDLKTGAQRQRAYLQRLTQG